MRVDNSGQVVDIVASTQSNRRREGMEMEIKERRGTGKWPHKLKLVKKL